RYPGATTFDGMILWWATTDGPKAVPGTYKVVLSTNGDEQEQTFEIVKDPRTTASQGDLEAQLDFLLSVRDKLSETNDAIITIRKVREQINGVMSKTDDAQIKELGNAILDDTKVIEEALYQTKNESRQDPLNFPIRLNNKLGHLASLEGVGDFKPTSQSMAFKDEVSALIDEQLDQLAAILKARIPEFNKAVYESKVDAVQLQD
ncbi:MAG: glycosyl hydrolase, partial [Bacteroidota bacterium]